MRRNLTIFCMLLATWLFAQKPPVCSSVMAPISSCAAACIHCNLDGYVSATNHLDVGGSPPPGFCTVIMHHIQYVGFVAGSTNLSIRVNVSNCTHGTSIELGIYKIDNCGDFTLVSNCNTAMFQGNAYVFTTTDPLDIGCPYYLVIDGNGPATCNFSVSVLSGSTQAPPVTFNGPIQGPDHVCQGEEATFTASHRGACYTIWTTDNGTITSPDDENEVTIQFDNPGMAEICFTAENMCNAPQEICKFVTVHPNPIEVQLGPFEICEGDEYMFDGRGYKEGYHEIPYTTIHGCDSTVWLDIVEVEVYRDRLNVSRCFPECWRRSGQELCISGTYPMIFQSITPPFCDSLITVNFNSIRIEPELISSGNLSCGDTIVRIHADSTIITGIGLVEYFWSNQAGEDLGDESYIEVSDPGVYCVDIVIRGPDGTECMETECIEIRRIIEDPEIVIDSVPTICFGDTLFFRDVPVSELNGYSGQYTYHSDIPDTSNRLGDYIVVTDTTDLWVLFSAGPCADSLPFQVLVAPSPILSDPTNIQLCEGDTLFLQDIVINHSSALQGMISFHEGFPNAMNEVSNYIIPNDSTNLYVQSTFGDCGDIKFIPIELLIRPENQFMISSDTICLGDTITVQYLGNYNSDYDFVWTKGGIWLDSIGPEQYTVTFDAHGVYDIELLVDNQGCNQGVNSRSVLVEQPITSLDWTCEQSDSAVSFRWLDIFGAQGYTVTELTALGTGSRTNDTTYTISGLQNGDIVRIRVEVQGPESCPPFIIEMECKAVYCPPATLQVDSVNYVCLDSNSSAIPLAAVIQGLPNPMSDYRWFGPGVADSSQALFDPKLAGIGRHYIRVEYHETDCQWSGGTWIDVRRTPVASYTGDTVICQDSTLIFEFDGLAGMSTNGTWDWGGGFALPGINVFDRNVTWSEPGQKMIQFILEENGCTSVPFTQSITVESPPDTLVWMCDSGREWVRINFRRNDPFVAPFVQVLTGQNHTVEMDTSILISGLTPGETVTVTLVVSSMNTCADWSTEITCMAQECPPISFNGPDTVYVCDDGEVNAVQLVKTAPGMGSYQWIGPAISDPIAGWVDLSLLNYGNHLYRVMYTEEGCMYEDSVYLNYNALPEFDLLSQAYIYCNQTVIAIAKDQNPNYQYQWSNAVQQDADSFYLSQGGVFDLTVFVQLRSVNQTFKLR